jgi:aspartate aminotransferase
MDEMNEIEARLQPSPTLAAAEMVRELQSDGKPVFRFDIGEPDFDTPQHVKDAALEAIRSGYTHYTSAKGLPELRAAIANNYVAKGVPVKPENVAVFPGSKFALYAVLSLLTDPGDEVMIQDPSWPSYASMITFLHGLPIFVPAPLEQHFVPTIHSFQERVTDRTKAVIINSPGNPTGAVYPRCLMSELRELCEQRRPVLISDEIYSALVYNGQAPSPLEDPESDGVIVASGFSKEFAMTGWRLGYTVASRRVTDLLVRFMENTATCPTSFVQKAAVAALTGPRDWFTEMLAEYRTRREAMIEGLSKITGWQCGMPEGAFYCFPRTNFKDTRLLEKMLLEKRRVSVVAGAYFGPSGEKHVRLSYTTSRKNIRDGIELIRQYVEHCCD